jgi:hypothetical protein
MDDLEGLATLCLSVKQLRSGWYRLAPSGTPEELLYGAYGVQFP